MYSIKPYLRRGVILTLLLFVTPALPADIPNQFTIDPGAIPQQPAPPLSTGIPSQFTIDPGSIRQQDKDQGTTLATVTLKVPSPTFFICQIRSSDPYKVSFTNIIFKKGQTQGTAQGTIYWLHIPKDSAVKISAFSVDDPDEKLWFTVALKVKDEDEENNPDNQNNQDKDELRNGPQP